MAIAAIVRLEKHRLGYRVPSQSGKGSYIVDPDTDNPCCSCADFDIRQQPCKHIYAVQITIQREEEVTVEADGTRGADQAPRQSRSGRAGRTITCPRA